MIIANECFTNMINAPVRTVKARVELYSGSTLVNTFSYKDALKSFSIERTGETKFFGFGICQKLTVKLVDRERKIEITKANTLEPAFGSGCDYIYICPVFYVEDVSRDELTNEITVIAYDALLKANNHTVKELGISNYSIKALAAACAAILNLPLNVEAAAEEAFSLVYENGANFSGEETIRAVLNAIAEATQTVYYINHNWELTFKRLDKDGVAALEIPKAQYFNLDSNTGKKLTAICHATELGDNVIADSGAGGITQYIRNNPLWDLREDIAQLVDNALVAVNGLEINQFNLNWRGNFLVEIGDKLKLITKDNSAVYAYLLNDTLTYDGAMNQISRWSYTETNESASNPSSLGDVIKQTYARVDKANRQIELVASKTDAISDETAAIRINTDSINNSVSALQTNINEATKEVEELQKQVNLTMTSEQVLIEIESKVTEGINNVNKVETATGFTFDDNGLTIAKTNSKLTTLISEDGMSVSNSGEEVLVANNEGVVATDLHAKTYLIIGNNSRFEDMGTNRTACFWIGG